MSHALSAAAHLAPASLRRRGAVARRATRKSLSPSASLAENELIDIELSRPLGIVLGSGPNAIGAYVAELVEGV